MPEAEPHEVAIMENFWTIQIRALDLLIDSTDFRHQIFAASKFPKYSERIEMAAEILREVRNELLVKNYDANRRGEMIKK